MTGIINLDPTHGRYTICIGVIDHYCNNSQWDNCIL